MVGLKQTGLRAQRGLSLTGLIGMLAVVSMIALVAFKVFPTFMEYRSSKVGIAAAKKTGGTPKEMRDAFDKTADVNYVTDVKGGDLIIYKENGESEVAFSYDKQIPLFTNVSLLIHYEATTDPRGIIPEKPAEPTR